MLAASNGVPPLPAHGVVSYGVRGPAHRMGAYLRAMKWRSESLHKVDGVRMAALGADSVVMGRGVVQE